MQGHAIGCLFAHTVTADIEAGELIELPLTTNALVIEVRLVASTGAFARHAARDLINLATASCRHHERGSRRYVDGRIATADDYQEADFPGM